MRSLWMSAALLAVACSTVRPPTSGSGGSVFVHGGTFVMGSEPADVPALRSAYGVDWPGAFENEVPAHEVTLSDFRIDRHEVTYARFAEFLDAVPAWRRGRLDRDEHNGRYLADWRDGRYPEDKAQHPVVFVTWAAAQSYCRWRGGSLPSEAQWEFVARSGGAREFPWGDERPSPERANYYASGVGGPVGVGQYPPNDLGVFDLAGNVWEFLMDAWAPDYPEGAQRDPIAGGRVDDRDIRGIRGRRAVRGASFDGSVVNLRTRWRDSHVVTNAIEFVGFRCAYPAAPGVGGHRVRQGARLARPGHR